MNAFRTFIFALLLLTTNQTWASTDDAIAVQAIQLQRQGLKNVMAYMQNQPDIFARAATENTVLNMKQKSIVLDTWALFLDYMSALDIISDNSQNVQVYAVAVVAHYRFALQFIDQIERDPELVKWLNSKHKDQNLPKNFYRRFRNEMLGEYRTRQFEDAQADFSFYQDPDEAMMILSDLDAIHKISRFLLLTKNQKNIIKHSLYRVYYPIQKGVARGMGKVKFWRFGKTLITPEQALAYSYAMEPGDFYLTRKEWRMTNVGIPGFWTHSALYIGTPEERAWYFDTEEVNDWVRSKGAESFEQLLSATSQLYADHPGYDAMGNIRVLEALDDGVIFNSIETSLDADGAAVFRPKLSKLDKAKAIYNAFHYVGRPYDFHFDFDSDDALVCSELIYKAYLHGEEGQQGIHFPLNRSVGKKMLTPSEIAKWYDETVGTADQQVELVMFIDSNEKKGVAFLSTEEAFIGSWHRPDWYIFTQPEQLPEQTLAQTEASDS